MAAITAANASCFVHSYKDGVLARLAHDLKFRVGSFAVHVDARGVPTEACFDAGSLEIVCQMQDGVERHGSLSDADRKKILDNALRDVLDVAHFPEVRFEFASVVPDGDGYHVRGKLVLHGQARELDFVSHREGNKQVAEIRLDQTRFGIKPFTAMLGALKIKPEVLVRIELPEGN